jgi:DNA anti-recombination protein RmuC
LTCSALASSTLGVISAGPLLVLHITFLTFLYFQQSEREETLEENIRNLEQAKSDLSIRAENAERQIQVLEENILKLESKFLRSSYNLLAVCTLLSLKTLYSKNAVLNQCTPC